MFYVLSCFHLLYYKYCNKFFFLETKIFLVLKKSQQQRHYFHKNWNQVANLGPIGTGTVRRNRIQKIRGLQRDVNYLG
jgi:hypothetical protein